MTDQARNTAGALLGLHAQTALHPGAGTALGTVDLPVQRERHTHWPTIAGSALKGILRDDARSQIATRPDLDNLPRHDDRAAAGDQPEHRAERTGTARKKADATLELNLLFGPPTAGSHEFAGALSVTDARLLAYPVRSLKGVFAWATCPAVLERLERDADLARLTLGWRVPQVANNQAITVTDCPCLIEGNSLVLEEFEFTRAEGDPTAVARWIADNLLPEREVYQRTRARFVRQLVVLSDDDFTHFVRHATEVTARIGLNYETKTVRDGALFYQEFLPAESLFYAVVLASPARARNGQASDAPTLLKRLADGLSPMLQVGGDETTGKGFCATRLSLTNGRA
jgi:CRISPR-associated protein Cmr4